jgi:hypothetical protein
MHRPPIRPPVRSPAADSALVVVSADQPGVRARLYRVPVAPAETYLVRLGPLAAREAGISRRAGWVLGGTCRITAGWAVVAYTERTHLFFFPQLTADLDDVGDLSQAVAALIAYWRRADGRAHHPFVPPAHRKVRS